MRRALFVLALAAGLTAAGDVLAQDHLAAPEAIRERLASAAEARVRDQQAVEAALARPEAAQAARLTGTDLGVLRSVVPTLGDAELADLAERARALEQDPVAGRIMDDDIRLLLLIFLILAIVILVLKAVD